jgi:hypothetical protein
MRYMFLIHSPPGRALTPELMQAVNESAERAKADGSMILTGGLMPPSAGAAMRLAKGKVITVDGPFTESKEVVGGFGVFEFATHEEALKSLADFMELHRVHGGDMEMTCELRPIYG